MHTDLSTFQSISIFSSVLNKTIKSKAIYIIMNISNSIRSVMAAESRLSVRSRLLALALVAFSWANPVQAGKPAAPAAPSNLSATAASGTQINVRWQDNSSNESGFTVNSAPSSAGPWTQIAKVGAGVTTFSHTGLAPGTTCYYRVSAYNSRGSSAYAGPVGATTPAGTLCTYSISPGSASFPSSGGSSHLSVPPGAGCAWSASSSASWLTITAGGSGSGNGTVYFSVAPNSSSSTLTGTITVGGQSFTVTESGVVACSYSISPPSASFSYGGGSSSFSVFAGAGCGWSASSSAAWLTITAGGSGSGNGTVYFSVAPNASINTLYGSITVGGQTFNVSQAGVACSYSISPGSANFGASGGGSTVSVTATAGCGWVATANDSWITITSGNTGNGNGTVYYSAGANTSTSPRTGSMTIAGQTFSVTEAAAAQTDTSPPTVSRTAPSAGSTVSGTVNLTASASDNVGVSRVEFYCDGSVLVGTATVSPYSVPCNTATMANGGHSFYATAYDAANNSSTSTSTSVTVNNVASTGGQVEWVRPAQGSSGYQVTPYGVAVDHSGNNIVAGGFIGTVDFGGGSVSSFNSSILRDIFVAKYTAQGTLSWFKHFGNFGNVLDNVAFCVAVDSQDNVVVSGAFQGTLDFGGAILSSAAGLDIFVVKYSASGSLLWAKRFGGAYDDVGRGVAIDSANNIILAASFQSPNTSFDGISLTPVGWADIALVKLSPAGATLWAKRYGSSGNEMPCSVAVDRSGDVVVAGDFFDTTDLGGGLVTSAGGSDFFLAKYSGADGSYRWSKTGGSANSDHAHCVTTDPNTGNVVVTGGFMGSANFGGGLVGGGSGGGLTLFLAGYGPLGNLLWLKTGGGDTAGDGDSGYGVKIDGSGNLALTGQFDSAMNFGTWPQDPWLLGKGYFVASFGISGDAMPTYRWTKRASGLQQSCGTAVALSSTGKVIPVGCFSGTVDFGGVSATASGVGVTAGFGVQYLP